MSQNKLAEIYTTIFNFFPEAKESVRDAQILRADGTVKFHQENVLAPETWSDRSVNVVADKYFCTNPETGGRESSVFAMSARVANAITNSMHLSGSINYYDAVNHKRALCRLVESQAASFNSPVWFNVGRPGPNKALAYKVAIADGFRQSAPRVRSLDDVTDHPQASACFIQGVADNMESLNELMVKESNVFRHGSGSGSDFTTIRSNKEKLSGGGRPSGPMSFLRVYDRIASVVKSGGKTRRAAKMQTMRCDHLDIIEFIEAKWREAEKAKALIAAGYSPGMDGDAYGTVAFQNANFSVRTTQGFFEDFFGGDIPFTLSGPTGEVKEQCVPSKILDSVSDATWRCGDPGLQYDDTINLWHTCPRDMWGNEQRINSSNPCSEYLFIDDSACNLASLNLMKFKTESGEFDWDAFRCAIHIVIWSMNELIDMASYPSEEIAENSHLYRTLGLGYANLGGLIQSYGLPYDSSRARHIAEIITSFMTACAYEASGDIAECSGVYPGWWMNKESHASVIRMHKEANEKIQQPIGDSTLSSTMYSGLDQATILWRNCCESAMTRGFANAQVTLLAPTGTIAFMMDCDTTGIEPIIANMAWKTLAGGGYIAVPNRLVVSTLKTLGYSCADATAALTWCEENGDIVKWPSLKQEHRKVFQTAIGDDPIAPKAHIDMMAAVQPFLSGGISKTVNVPESTTREQIKELYIYAYTKGCKSLAIYRDGSKGGQPLSTKKDEGTTEAKTEVDWKAKFDKVSKQLIDLCRGASGGVYVTYPNAYGYLMDEIVDIIKSGDVDGIDAPENFDASAFPPYSVVKMLRAEMLHHKSLSAGHQDRDASRKSPDKSRSADIHNIKIGNTSIHLIVGKYPDGNPCELFIQFSKDGSLVGGLLNTIGVLTSYALQYGVPLETLCRKFVFTQFEPRGQTNRSEVPFATSIVDAVFRFIGCHYVPGFEVEFGPKRLDEPKAVEEKGTDVPEISVGNSPAFRYHSSVDALNPPCNNCGGATSRTGTCFTCTICGEPQGGCS